MKRILFYSFILIHTIILGLLYLLTPILKQKKKRKGIAALPYYPSNWPGGKDRIAHWKRIFNDDNVKYDLYPAWENEDILALFEAEQKTNQFKRYRIFYKLYFSRIRTIFKLKNYEAVWIQRAFIPVFPFKHAYYEKLLKRIHPNVIYDFYDADYESNSNLVFETVKLGKKITVASQFLKEVHGASNINTFFLRYSIDTDEFIENKEGSREHVKIGWMGSPENGKQLVLIKDQLKQIEDDFPHVQFSFVCRELPDLGLKGLEVNQWGMDGFDYYEWLSQLDLGIVPFLEQTDRVKAKISMKNLEFMVAGVAQVVSPHVHSDTLINHESCIIALEDEWYQAIAYLTRQADKRKDFSERSRALYLEFHAYKQVYPQLKIILLDS